MLSIVQQAAAAAAPPPPSIVEQAAAIAAATKMEQRFGKGRDEIDGVIRDQWNDHRPAFLEAAAKLSGSMGVYYFSIDLPHLFATTWEVNAVLVNMDDFKDIDSHVTVAGYPERTGQRYCNHFGVSIEYRDLLDSEFDKRVRQARMKALEGA